MEYNEKSLLVQPENLHKNSGLSLVYAIICIVDVFGVFPLIALPYTIVKCGYFGIPLILVVCSLQIYTAILLGRCWLQLEEIEPTITGIKRRYPYTALAEAAYGKTVAVLVTFVVNFGIFTASIPNLIVASQNLQLLTENVSGENVKITYCSWIIIVGVIICPFLWFGSPKDIKHLSTISGIIVLSVFGLLLYNMLSYTCGYNQNITPKNSVFETNISLWEILLSAYGMLTFQFDIHPTILNIHLDMKNKKNIDKALIGGYIVTIVLFGVIGIVAKIILGNNLLPSILESLSINTSLHIAAFLVAVQLATSSAICNNSLYQQIEESLGISNDFTWNRCAVRTVLTVITVIVAESVPRFDLVMSFVGGALTGPLAFIFPPLFYLKISKNARHHRISLVTVDPFREDTEIPKNSTIFWEDYFCILIIIVGFFMTVLSAYHSFVTNIQYSSFYPPCIYNFSFSINNFTDSV